MFYIRYCQPGCGHTYHDEKPEPLIAPPLDEEEERAKLLDPMSF